MSARCDFVSGTLFADCATVVSGVAIVLEEEEALSNGSGFAETIVFFSSCTGTPSRYEEVLFWGFDLRRARNLGMPQNRADMFVDRGCM